MIRISLERVCIDIFALGDRGSGDRFFLVPNLLRGTFVGILRDLGKHPLVLESHRALISISNWGIYRARARG